MSGGTTWCSIGLFPEGGAIDAGSEPDAAAAIEEDARAPESPDASAESPDASDLARPNSGDCACRAASSRGPIPLTLLLATGLGVAVGARRRRARARERRLGTLGLGALLLVSCTPEVVAIEPALGEATEAAESASRAPSLVTGGAPVRILEERELVPRAPDGAEPFSPMISPDGHTVLVTRGDESELFAWRGAAPERLATICARAHCGHEPRFFGAGRVATRTPEQSASAIPGDAFTLEGAPVAERLGAHDALAWVDDEEDVVRVRVEGTTRTLARGGDRFVRAELSPDRRHVVAWGLASGVSLHRLSDGARFELGGGSPHFDPSGRVLVLDRTEDDGHGLTAGDVLIVELDDPPTVRVVPDAGRLAHAPSVSRLGTDGTATLAFERDGAIVIARVALR